jgi:NADH dehydrogenase
VEILLNTKLTDYNGSHVSLGDGRQIPTQTLVWTAGVRAADLAGQLGVKHSASGQILTEATLQLPGHPEVFILGDAAHPDHGREQALPMLATVAQQEARVTASNLQRILKGREPQAFVYKDPGLLATIGRNAAVAHIWGLSFSGYIAWVIWVMLHIYRIIGFRNRLVVLINWAWDYVFYDTQVRLITGE